MALSIKGSSGGVDNQVPAFSAYQSAAQSLASSAITKLQFQTEEFDTNGNYDTATFRFTPNIAGYYQISAGFQIDTTAAGLNLYLYKNGVSFKFLQALNGATVAGAYGSALVFLNGTTDYVEIFGTQGAVTQNSRAGVAVTYFQAVMARPA